MSKVKGFVVSFLVLGLTFIAYQPAYSQQWGHRPDQKRRLDVLKERPIRERIGKMVLFETLTDKQKKQIVVLRNKYQEILVKAIKKRGEQLKKIKASDPEKFNQIIEEAKRKVRARMRNQKKHHPQKFEQFQRMNSNYLKEKMEWLQEDDPELYRYIIEKAKQGSESEYYQERRNYQRPRPFEPGLREPLFDDILQ
jgi:hypothetical protein